MIKAGFDSKVVLARFDPERQAPALMDHPHIARVFDGGVSPFFVMELIGGISITAYCDRRKLPVRPRLELFVSVCLAVQHAHQKGIIHRDLQPGNILVTEVDGRPTPKIIDFGVAKATEQKLTESSFSDAGATVGTPAYMSPEQADPSSMDTDSARTSTRSASSSTNCSPHRRPSKAGSSRRMRSWKCSAWYGKSIRRSRARRQVPPTPCRKSPPTAASNRPS